MNFFEKIGVLSDGETTELIQSLKNNKNELEIIKDLISKLSGKGNS